MKRRSRLSFLLSIVLSTLSACLGQQAPSQNEHPVQTKADTYDRVVLDVSRMASQGWRHLPIRGKTDYQVIAMDGALAVQATGRKSASGLIRRLDINNEACPILSWRWRVDQSQTSADLTKKSKDDVAAAIFLMFGDPGLLSDPEPVPTLRYVWTTARHKKGAVVANPYLPTYVRNMVLVRDPEQRGVWQSERRHILKDFKAAFGHLPDEDVHAIAVFTDNDQTLEPVRAYYGQVAFHCSN